MFLFLAFSFIISDYPRDNSPKLGTSCPRFISRTPNRPKNPKKHSFGLT
ncbi:hypothetical protein [Moraxella lacunata]